MQYANNALDKKSFMECDCHAYNELDWIIDEGTVVRPGCMIVCGKFTQDFLTLPPTFIAEISSGKTRLRDRNTKYNLYELQGDKYYLLADREKKSVGVFELLERKYAPKTDMQIKLSPECAIDLNIYSIWQSM